MIGIVDAQISRRDYSKTDNISDPFESHSKSDQGIAFRLRIRHAEDRGNKRDVIKSDGNEKKPKEKQIINHFQFVGNSRRNVPKSEEKKANERKRNQKPRPVFSDSKINLRYQITAQRIRDSVQSATQKSYNGGIL